MAKSQRLELTWMGKEIRPRLEPRILIEDESLSYCAPTKKKGDIFDNMLIFGDNLLALKSLEQHFTGKVKCVYIDPPYNTGSAFEHYDDGVEHSLWLGLMRDRLELLRKLLSNDGMLFVQIDNRELHYLKVMMDEIFGRDNYRNTIIVRKGVKNVQKQFATVERLNAGYDSILVYSKNSALRIPNLFGKIAQEDVTGSWNNHWRGTDRPTMRYELFGITPPTGQWRWSKERTYIAVENYKTFLREEKSQVELLSQEDFDRMYEQYLSAHQIRDKKEFELVRLSKNGKPEHYIPPSDEILLSENWMDLAVVGRITSFEHEKNEFIIQRILNWASQPGDLVLDSFLGSGTTAAVAHKMGRRWIGIELGEHCHTHCIPRLKKVIDGEDPGGITKAVDWKGGGGFRYFRLAPTLLKKDKYGFYVINKEYNPEMLAEAMCKLHGFTYAPNPDIYWMHGQSTETDYIYVTTQFFTPDLFESLSDEVGKGRTLLILCKGFRGNTRKYSNLTVQKIPNSILAQYEWEHDDYSLKIENLPVTQKKKKAGKSMPLFDDLDDEEGGAE